MSSTNRSIRQLRQQRKQKNRLDWTSLCLKWTNMSSRDQTTANTCPPLSLLFLKAPRSSFRPSGWVWILVEVILLWTVFGQHRWESQRLSARNVFCNSVCLFRQHTTGSGSAGALDGSRTPTIFSQVAVMFQLFFNHLPADSPTDRTWTDL